MAEGGAQKPIMTTDEPKEEKVIYGLINIKQQRKYSNGLEKIMDDLRNLLWERKDDALEVAIKQMKKYRIKMWPDMSGANVNVMMSSIQELSA